MESCGSKGDAHLNKDSNTAWREGWRTGKLIASVAQRMMMVRGCWPVICVVCGTHTRCAGIENADALPSKFHCFKCIDLYNKRPKQSVNERGPSQMPLTGLVCRGESAAMGSGSNLSLTLRLTVFM